jgi:hypothetical protein
MVATRKRLIVLSASFVGVAVLALLFPLRTTTKDYGSGAAGVVVDTGGNPVPGAKVTLSFDETVFDAITPVNRADLVTDSSGRFQDYFISCGKPGGAYTVTIERVGFQTARVHGRGMGSHRVVLHRQDAPPMSASRNNAG